MSRLPVAESGGSCGVKRSSGCGGSAWESNPPRDAGRRATGFEDQGAHRDPSAPPLKDGEWPPSAG